MYQKSQFLVKRASKELGCCQTKSLFYLVYCSTETKSVIFLSDFGSFASFRPQVRKASVTEKCLRNANIFSFIFPLISILIEKVIFRMNFFYYFVLKTVMHQSIPAAPIPPPRATAGHLYALSVPGSRALSYARATPGFLTHVVSDSKSNEDDFIGKDQ